MSTYEEDVRLALKTDLDSGEIREAGEAATVLDSLCRIFPVNGSKIDWRRVPGSVESAEENEALQNECFAQFFDEVKARFGLSGSVTYVGDSATEFALEGTVNAIRKVLPTLLEVPQHHYFIGQSYSWCLCLTMEGDMGFGFSENAINH